jgi:hypothetical protein
MLADFPEDRVADAVAVVIARFGDLRAAAQQQEKQGEGDVHETSSGSARARVTPPRADCAASNQARNCYVVQAQGTRVASARGIQSISR